VRTDHVWLCLATTLSGNRVLFRTFSFILLTFIPLSPSYPFILLTHTFLYTFQFSLMITGKRTRNEFIGRRDTIITVQAFPWLRGDHVCNVPQQLPLLGPSTPTPSRSPVTSPRSPEHPQDSPRPPDNSSRRTHQGNSGTSSQGCSHPPPLSTQETGPTSIDTP
jgi:hypothetical protein